MTSPREFSTVFPSSFALSLVQKIDTMRGDEESLMKAEICLLDLDYEELDGNISIILHGKTPDRVVVVDLAYEPYFCDFPKNLNKAKREIEATLQKRNVKVKKIRETKKLLLGRESSSRLIV